jgi:tRNA(fMet)-specific endonuclease VapC
LPPGARRDRIRAYLEERVRPTLPILPFDTAAGEWQARERARWKRSGVRPPYADSQIAAIAAVNGLVLVTRNTEDFADFSGLIVENWFDPRSTSQSQHTGLKDLDGRI